MSIDEEFERARKYLHALIDKRFDLHREWIQMKDVHVTREQDCRVFGASAKTVRMEHDQYHPQLHYLWRSRVEYEKSIGL